MLKPFKGVIKDWGMVGNRIHGNCVIHIEERLIGPNIHTSDVQQIYTMEGVKIAVTKNSLYVLI